MLRTGKKVKGHAHGTHWGSWAWVRSGSQVSTETVIKHSLPCTEASFSNKQMTQGKGTVKASNLDETFTLDCSLTLTVSVTIKCLKAVARFKPEYSVASL